MRHLITIAGSVVLLLTSCNNENEYSTQARASFSMNNTVSSPMLYRALENMNEYVTLRRGNTAIEVTNVKGQTESVALTAVSNYNAMYMGLGGFIIGRPTIPEIGSDVCAPVCYDFVCPNCFEESNITKRLELQEGGFAYCPRCTRRYNLNNGGIISSDTTGVKLYRYHLYYTPPAMVIRN